MISVAAFFCSSLKDCVKTSQRLPQPKNILLLMLSSMLKSLHNCSNCFFSSFICSGPSCCVSRSCSTATLPIWGEALCGSPRTLSNQVSNNSTNIPMSQSSAKFALWSWSLNSFCFSQAAATIASRSQTGKIEVLGKSENADGTGTSASWRFCSHNMKSMQIGSQTTTPSREKISINFQAIAKHGPYRPLHLF